MKLGTVVIHIPVLVKNDPFGPFTLSLKLTEQNITRIRLSITLTINHITTILIFQLNYLKMIWIL